MVEVTRARAEGRQTALLREEGAVRMQADTANKTLSQPMAAWSRQIYAAAAAAASQSQTHAQDVGPTFTSRADKCRRLGE